MRCSSLSVWSCLSVFFFNDPSTSEFYTLSLHDALPISLLVANRDAEACRQLELFGDALRCRGRFTLVRLRQDDRDRKSTRLNSSHRCISYAVFCLKKKKKIKT